MWSGSSCVCDNLNTHKLGSLYEAFEPHKARSLAERLRIHYTPKHGSLVERSGNRAECAEPAMPGSSHRNSTEPNPAHPGVV